MENIVLVKHFAFIHCGERLCLFAVVDANTEEMVRTAYKCYCVPACRKDRPIGSGVTQLQE